MTIGTIKPAGRGIAVTGLIAHRKPQVGRVEIDVDPALPAAPKKKKIVVENVRPRDLIIP